MEDSEHSVDIGVVEEEDRVEGAVGDPTHPASYQAVDGVVDAFYRVVLIPTIVSVGVVGEGWVAGLTR